MAKTFNLILSVPESEPMHYRLSGEKVTLGRGQGNRIPVEVRAISGRHCQFRRAESGGYRLVDLGSTNGTRVNGQRVMDSAGVALKNGDRILFGETVEAHFFEAIDAENLRKRRSPELDTAGGEGESGAIWPPVVPVWVDASAGNWNEEVAGTETVAINPVAAAVARQEAAMGNGSAGRG